RHTVGEQTEELDPEDPDTPGVRSGMGTRSFRGARRGSTTGAYGVPRSRVPPPRVWGILFAPSPDRTGAAPLQVDARAYSKPDASPESRSGTPARAAIDAVTKARPTPGPKTRRPKKMSPK